MCCIIEFVFAGNMIVQFKILEKLFCTKENILFSKFHYSFALEMHFEMFDAKKLILLLFVLRIWTIFNI